MKKIVFTNIFLAAFLLVAGSALAAGSDGLDVTMRLMGAGDHDPEMITNQIRMPEIQKIRAETMVMNGEQNGSLDRVRTRARTEEMEQLRDTSRTLAQEEKRQTMMDESGPHSAGGGAR